MEQVFSRSKVQGIVLVAIDTTMPVKGRQCNNSSVGPGIERATLHKFSQRSKDIAEKVAQWKRDARDLAKVTGRQKANVKDLTEADLRQLDALETRAYKRKVSRAEPVNTFTVTAMPLQRVYRFSCRVFRRVQEGNVAFDDEVALV